MDQSPLDGSMRRLALVQTYAIAISMNSSNVLIRLMCLTLKKRIFVYAIILECFTLSFSIVIFQIMSFRVKTSRFLFFMIFHSD